MSVGLLGRGHRKSAEVGPCCMSSVHLYRKYKVQIAKYKGQTTKWQVLNEKYRSVCSLEIGYCDLFLIRIELDLEVMRV